MISLQPREQFMLVRQLADHTDLSTYYVRAVIKNSVSGETLATVNLTDGGNGRFTKLWEVPSDISGLGFYIDITISVYSDSGYTTKASSYGDSNEQYLVFDRIVKHGGGGGVDVDYKKIQKMLATLGEEVKKAMPKEADFKPLAKILKDMNASINAIDIPEPEKLDTGPVLTLLNDRSKAILDAIEAKPVTEVPNILPAILEGIEKKEPNLEGVFAKIKDLRDALSEYVKYDMSREMGAQATAAGKLKDLAEKILPILGNNLPIPAEKPKDRVMSLLEN